ncbi:MAG: TIM barrel protein [Planctomycetota bacterium]
MDRRTFLATGIAAGAATALDMTARAQNQPAGAQQQRATAGGHFRLKYAPSLGCFKEHAGPDPLEELKFMAAEGFRAFFDNGLMGRPPEVQEQIGQTARDLDLTVGAFCSYLEFGKPTLVLDKPEERERLLAEIRKALETARRTGGKWTLVVPGLFEPRLPLDYQTANLVEHLRAAAEVAEPAGLVIVLEPLNWRDHPNLFLQRVGQAYQICRAVNSPSVKIVDDIYHQQITEGNLIPNIDLAWNEIVHFHLGDNPGRREPGTGEINFRGLFRHLHQRGFDGVLALEHGISRKGKEGERWLIDVYQECDAF